VQLPPGGGEEGAGAGGEETGGHEHGAATTPSARQSAVVAAGAGGEAAEPHAAQQGTGKKQRASAHGGKQPLAMMTMTGTKIPSKKRRMMALHEKTNYDPPAMPRELLCGGHQGGVGPAGFAEGEIDGSVVSVPQHRVSERKIDQMLRAWGF
jgi:hypothetical protein